MSRRFPRAKWVLPDVVDPDTSTCWAVPIPDDRFHKAAFLGALQILGSAASWGDDPDHTALAAAHVWREIADNLAECAPMVQFRHPDPCVLEASFDGGSNWEPIFDASTCVDNLILSGRYGQFGPSAPTQPQVPANCTSQRITLYANSAYQWPYLVNAGDTIVTNVIYGVWSGTLNQFSDTHCADGGFLDSFAQCGGTADPGHTGDPLPTANHMRLVANLDGTWVDAYNASITVPGGVVDGVLQLQANDDVLLDNVGYAIIDIEVCVTGWCNTWDFATDAYAAQWNVGNGVYASGMYSNPGSGGNPDTVDIDIAIPASSGVVRIVVAVNSQNVDTNGAFRGIYRATFDNVQQDYDDKSGDYTMEFVAASSVFDAHTLHIQVSNEHTYSPGNNHIKRVTLYGIGTDPFSARDCP